MIAASGLPIHVHKSFEAAILTDFVVTPDRGHPGAPSGLALSNPALWLCAVVLAGVAVIDMIVSCTPGLLPNPERQSCLGVQLKGSTTHCNGGRSLLFSFKSSAAEHDQVVFIFWHRATLSQEVSICPASPHIRLSHQNAYH